MVIKYKASNLIADFNLNAKTALTTLSELLGTEIKKSTVLTEEQANVAFEALSNKAKIENAAEYLSSAAKKQQDKQAEKPARDVKKEQPQNPNAQKTAKRTARTAKIIKIKRTPRKAKPLNHRIIKNRLRIKRLKRKINLKTVKTIIPATTRGTATANPRQIKRPQTSL